MASVKIIRRNRFIEEIDPELLDISGAAQPKSDIPFINRTDRAFGSPYSRHPETTGTPVTVKPAPTTGAGRDELGSRR